MHSYFFTGLRFVPQSLLTRKEEWSVGISENLAGQALSYPDSHMDIDSSIRLTLHCIKLMSKPCNVFYFLPGQNVDVQPA